MQVSATAAPTAQSQAPTVTPHEPVESTDEDDTQMQSDEPLMDGNDFLQIMAAQLANQSIMDPIDTAQYITQMAVMANTVQMMYISEQATVDFAMNMIGKEVTIAGYNSEAEYQEWTGTVDSVVFQGGETWIEMDGYLYSPNDVVRISEPGTQTGEDDEEPVDPDYGVPVEGVPEEPFDPENPDPDYGYPADGNVVDS